MRFPDCDRTFYGPFFGQVSGHFFWPAARGYPPDKSGSTSPSNITSDDVRLTHAGPGLKAKAMEHQAPQRKPLSPQARRNIALGVGALALILTLFILGRTTSLLDVEALQQSMQELAASPWALPALFMIYVIGAFLGVPQFGLIAMSVAAFGPMTGALFSWMASMVSGTVTFWVGRLTGERAFRRYAGNTANKLIGYVGRNAFATSAIVRNVPAGPFLIVNMAFGVSPAKFTHYLAGMGVGVIPKIALIAFAGQSLVAALKGNPLLAIGAALAAAGVYFGIVTYARARMRKSRQSVALIDQNEVDIGPETDDERPHVE